MVKASVIIPSYNRGYILREAVDSVLGQSLQDFELLVIDDGSTDNTREAVDSIDDERVHYYYKENGGVSSARNLGMSKAKGEYVAFLDSDDIWPGDFLEVMAGALDSKQDYGLAYTATTVLHEDGSKEEGYNRDRCVSGEITTELFEKSFIWPMAVLIRRDILDNFWFDEKLKNSDDNDAFLRLSVRAKFLFVSEIEVIRRSSGDAHSKARFVLGSCNRALSLERFYYQLGGERYVPKNRAKKKISKVYRRAAERHRKAGYRKGSLYLYKRAIRYNPFDVRLYSGLIKSMGMDKRKDQQADWIKPAEPGKVSCYLEGNS
jgi:glycosyltransferase involved in cell wall biosynthesis